MQESPITIRPEDVPKTYAVCFHDQCPHREQCTRYAAGKAASTSRNQGPCVYPTALRDGQCPMFRQLRIIRSAWGFRTLFADVQKKDYDRLRWKVICHFSSESDFWRYNRGYYKLTPEQQEAVLDIFRQFGYDPASRHFRHYEEKVDFS